MEELQKKNFAEGSAGRRPDKASGRGQATSGRSAAEELNGGQRQTADRNRQMAGTKRNRSDDWAKRSRKSSGRSTNTRNETDGEAEKQQKNTAKTCRRLLLGRPCACPWASNPPHPPPAQGPPGGTKSILTAVSPSVANTNALFCRSDEKQVGKTPRQFLKRRENVQAKPGVSR